MTEQNTAGPALLTDLIAAGGKPFDPLYLQAMGDDAEEDDGADAADAASGVE